MTPSGGPRPPPCPRYRPGRGLRQDNVHLPLGGCSRSCGRTQAFWTRGCGRSSCSCGFQFHCWCLSACYHLHMKAPSSYVALLTTTLSECWMMHANSQSDMEFGSLRTHTLGCVLIHNCSQIRCSSGVKTVTEVVATYTATHINVGCKQACCMLIPAPAYLTSSTVNAGDSKHTKSGRCRHQQQGKCTSGLFKCVL